MKNGAKTTLQLFISKKRRKYFKVHACILRMLQDVEDIQINWKLWGRRSKQKTFGELSLDFINNAESF